MMVVSIEKMHNLTRIIRWNTGRGTKSVTSGGRDLRV